MAFWSTFCAFVGLCFAAETLGLFGHELNTALAWCLLLPAAALDPPWKGAHGATRRGLYAAGALAALAGFGALAGHVHLRFFGAALYFAGLDALAAARGRRVSALLPLAIGCMLHGIYRWGADASLLAWYGTQNGSRWLSEIAGRACGQPLSLGPSFNGFEVFVLGLCIAAGWLAAADLSWRAAARFAVTACALALAYCAYLAIFALMPLALPAAESAPSWWRLAAAALHPLHIPLLAAPLLAAPVAWCLRPSDASEAPGPARPTAWRPIAAAAAAAVLAIWALTNVPAARQPAPRRVAFYEKGFLNWMKPTHARYGRYSAGMFGNLPLLIRAMGWEADTIPEITPDTLAGAHILVIINQDTPLPAASIGMIDHFVEQGGALLVLGDHTFWKTERRILCDEPLERTQIRFQFDCANFFVGGWLHSYAFRPHATTARLGDRTNEPGIVVGASLAVSYPAAPLVIGRYGFSDPGVPEQTERGYMGNMQYDPGEMLGDVVLAAAQNVGRGRVFVVGDTSGFTNGILDHTWPFVQRIFWWLGTEGRAAVPLWRDILGLVLAVLAAAGLVAAARANRHSLLVLAPVFLAALWVSRAVTTHVGAPPPLSGKVALVDTAHAGRFSPEGWHPDGIDGVFLHLMRDGYFAAAAKTFDAGQVMASDLFVTIAPSRPFGRDAVRVLKRFMEQGGTVLLAAGWEERAGAAPLLAAAGIEIAGRPLGRAQGHGPPLSENPMLFEAWPVLGGETLLSAHGEPVVTLTQIGKGRLIVIGDTQFLRNKNIEVKEGGILRNIRFLSWLLEQTKGD